MCAHFLLSKKSLSEKYQSLISAGFLVSYSFKTNPEVGSILEKDTDCDISIHYIDSLKNISDTKRVWFLTQALTKESLDSLWTQGVRKYIIDNEEDLSFFLGFIEDKSEKVDLLLRMKLQEKTVMTGRYYVFGISPKKINNLIPQLRNNKNIQRLGIHFHRKTQNVSEWNLTEELQEWITPENFSHIDLLNIGGGFPSCYVNSKDSYLSVVFEKLEKLKEWLKNDHDTKLMVEPGRFLCAEPVRLHTKVIQVVDNTIIVDCSVYNSSMDTILVPLKLLVAGEQEVGNSYIIKGNTPCSMDIFRYDVKFSHKPKIGDNLVFLNAGAYNFKTEFCHLPKLETKVVDDFPD
jgi:ornithine decarboxylase